MKLHRLSVRWRLAGAPPDLEALIGVFHRAIQGARLEGLLLDVADYRHIPQGPGVLLVGHDADYGCNAQALSVVCKRQGGAAAAADAQLRRALRMLFGLHTLLAAEDEIGALAMAAELEVAALDRLRAPNVLKAADSALHNAVQSVCGELFGEGAAAIRPAADAAADARAAPAFAVEIPGGINPAAALKRLPPAPARRIPQTAPQSEWDISAEQLRQWQNDGAPLRLLDVREAEEFAQDNLGGELVPLKKLGAWLKADAPPKKTRVAVHCHSGVRGAQAVKKLRAAGFADAWNLRGGLLAWRENEAAENEA